MQLYSVLVVFVTRKYMIFQVSIGEYFYNNLYKEKKTEVIKLNIFCILNCPIKTFFEIPDISSFGRYYNGPRRAVFDTLW